MSSFSSKSRPLRRLFLTRFPFSSPLQQLQVCDSETTLQRGDSSVGKSVWCFGSQAAQVVPSHQLGTAEERTTTRESSLRLPSSSSSFLQRTHPLLSFHRSSPPPPMESMPSTSAISATRNLWTSRMDLFLRFVVLSLFFPSFLPRADPSSSSL